MYDYPASFPSDAISEGISIVQSGALQTRLRDFVKDAENVQFWAVGVALKTPTEFTTNMVDDQQKTRLQAFADVLPAAHEHLSAHKLGNGQLLGTIMQWLPTILSILKLFGVNTPTLPTLPVPTPTTGS